MTPSSHHSYRHPLAERYASDEMIEIFSPITKIRTWRDLWIALAESEKELGLDITDEQIAAMRNARDDIDLERAAEIEHEIRHDVMAHIRAFGEKCPSAAGIIHLGATSCFVGDNADIILMKRALTHIRNMLIAVIRELSGFCRKHAALPALGFTHYQPAQVVTVGKRACLWLQDYVLDLDDALRTIASLRMRGVKGTTGTQASFMRLFNGNSKKVKKLDKLVTEKMGFEKSFQVTGQTYSRKIDATILSVLSGIAQSASKMANDIRLLSNLREVSEPFEDKQVGSSAMAYKRNPMRCERISSIARYLILNCVNPSVTASQQWMERTLDDSANRRMVIPESFMAADAVLTIVLNVLSGLNVHEEMIRRNLERELPFMATENILMEAVKEGGDRQELHERIRQLSVEALQRIRKGDEGGLIEQIQSDPLFSRVADRIDKLVDPVQFTGRCDEQVTEFLASEVEPLLKQFKDISVDSGTVKV